MLSEKWREPLVLLGLTLVTLAVFVNTLQNSFVYDDHFLIVKNKALASQEYFSTIFTHSFGYDASDEDTYNNLPIDYYRPFIRLFFGLCYRAFGLNPAYWHLANLLVFLVVVLSCYFLVRELAGQSVAALATLLFAVHPLHSESVAYVNGSVDTLHAAFFFPSLLLFILYQKESDRKRRLEYMLGSCLLFLAALLTKELAITLPPLVAIYTLLYTKTEGWRARLWRVVKAVTPFLITFICYAVLRAVTYGHLGNSVSRAFKGRLDLQSTLMTIPGVVLEYLRMMLFPVDLNLFRSVPEVSSALSLRFWVTTGLLILILGVCLKLPVKLQMAAAILFVPLVAVLNIGVFPQNRMVQDRYAFINLLGFCILVAESALWLYASEKALVRQATALGMAVAILALSLLTVRQNGYWKDNLAIWKRVIETHPGSAALYCNIASILFYEQRREEGAEYYRQALALDPHAVCALKGLAGYYQENGNYKSAISLWEQIVSLGEAKDKNLHMMFLAQAYSLSGDNQKALKVLEHVISEFPDHNEARVLYSELTRIRSHQKQD